MNRTSLLTIDGIVNLLLGVLLIIFPDVLVDFLGIPSASPSFYPNILGGVLVGIGIALLIKRNNSAGGGIGLGLYGAASINLCGAIVLLCWLLFGNLGLSDWGSIVLWLLVATLVIVSAIEVVIGSKIKKTDT